MLITIIDIKRFWVNLLIIKLLQSFKLFCLLIAHNTYDGTIIFFAIVLFLHYCMRRWFYFFLYIFYFFWRLRRLSSKIISFNWSEIYFRDLSASFSKVKLQFSLNNLRFQERKVIRNLSKCTPVGWFLRVHEKRDYYGDP